jgi:hypothetical protein
MNSRTIEEIPRGRDVSPDSYTWSFQIARPIAKTPGVGPVQACATPPAPRPGHLGTRRSACSSMAPRPEKASVRTLSSGHSAVQADRQYAERPVIFPDVQLENRTGAQGRFICAPGSRFFLRNIASSESVRHLIPSTYLSVSPAYGTCSRNSAHC